MEVPIQRVGHFPGIYITFRIACPTLRKHATLACHEQTSTEWRVAWGYVQGNARSHFAFVAEFFLPCGSV
jgi:hypothetical protein